MAGPASGKPSSGKPSSDKPWLAEIRIPHCFAGKPSRFNAWRLAVADMTGVGLVYEEVDTPVSLAGAIGPVPRTLPLVQARLTESGAVQPTPAQRSGRWDTAPDDPLRILLLLTIPGGTIPHAFARGMADRLQEMAELLYAVDDGRYGTTDIGRLTDAVQRGLRAIGAGTTDVEVAGGFEPHGWWVQNGAPPS